MKENVAASTQNQALSALLFLYHEVLKKDLGFIDALRAKKPKRLPTILTQQEVRRVLNHLSGTRLLTNCTGTVHRAPTKAPACA